MSGLALFWADSLRATAGGRKRGTGKAKSVLLIFNAGAPSHLDLWDMKPGAPEGVRGLFNPVATNALGIRVSELLPHLARQADRYAVVRTVHHSQTQHNTGMYWSIVGRPFPLSDGEPIRGLL